MKNFPLVFLLLCLSAAAFCQDTALPHDTAPPRDTALLRDTTRLRDILIRAEKPLVQQQTGGLTVNVAGSLLTRGSTVLEVLERSPGVTIDPQNNGIDLNGKSGVSVMIDGRLMQMSMEQVVTLLSGMSADDIEKIELLTTPPANYDAEGSAGIINIVLKKNRKRGTNGSISVTGGYGYGEKGTAALNLTHNTEKIDLYGSYTWLHDRSFNYLFVQGSQDFPPLGGEMTNLTWDTAKPLRNDHTATLGLDARINPGMTIGGRVTYNNDRVSSASTDREDFDVLPDSLLLFNGTIHGVNQWKNLVTSVYLDEKLPKGAQLNFDVDYLHYHNNDPANIQSAFLTKDGNKAGTPDSLYSPLERSFAGTAIQVGVARMDYRRQLGKNGKLETGLKGTYTRDTSLSGIENEVNGVWVANAGTSNDIIMKEGIGAAYVSVTARLDSSATLVAGVRYEYSRTHMDNPVTGANTIDRKLGVLFPNLSYSRKLGAHSVLELSYTKRISRPSYNDLASYIGYSGPIADYTGNPLLMPTITNNLKGAYTYRGYSFSVLLSRDDYPIARYQLSENPAGNVLYISPQNMNWQNYLTFQANLPWRVNDWWTMTYNLTGGWRQFKEDYTISPVQKTYFAWSGDFNESFRLSGRFSVELSGWYTSSFYSGTTRINGFEVLNAGIKRELKKNRGAFQLAVSDLLRTYAFAGHYGTLTEEAFSVKNHFIYNTESRVRPIIKLTYTRSFGSGTIKSGQKPDAGSADEQGRVRAE